jgi:hypothetical protein
LLQRIRRRRAIRLPYPPRGSMGPSWGMFRSAVDERLRILSHSPSGPSIN